MKPMLSSTIISSDHFRYFADQKTFFAEKSELRVDIFTRLFEDACDVGFLMRSVRTNKCKPFAFSRTRDDAEGDIVAWEFVSSPSEYKLIVWND